MGLKLFKKKGLAIIICLAGMLCFTACGKEKTAQNSYKSGMELFEKEKYDEAVVKLNEAVTASTDKAEYYIAYGMALIETGEYETAQTQFDKAILDKENRIIRENNKQAHRGKGICYYETNQYTEAIEQFDKALKITDLSGLDLDILFYKGDAESKVGKYQEALLTYESILDRKKNDADTYGKKAQIEYILGDYENAGKDFDKAIRLDSDNYDLYFGKYFMLVDQADQAGAKDVLSKALAIKTKTEEDYFNLAKIHYFQQDYITSEGEFKDAANKGFSEAWYYLGQIHEGQKKYVDSIADYEQYLEENPDVKSAVVPNQLGLCYMKTKEYTKAIKMFQRGIKMNDNAIIQQLKFNEVAAYEALANFKKALAKANAYVKSYPNDKDMIREIEFLKTRVNTAAEKK